MGIFNLEAPSPWAPQIQNKAGAPAFKVDPRYELASILLTSFVKDKFYRSKESERDRLIELLKTVDPLFAAKAAVFARNEYGMRSVSHILAGEIAKSVKGQSWTGDFFKSIARRPDDMTEILAYYAASNPGAMVNGKIRKIPNAMKRGFAKRLTKFDEYQLGKYRGEGKAITLIDLVSLVHAKWTPALSKLMKGEGLKNTGTFEGEISNAGREAEDADTDEAKAEIKSDAWGKLITERKIGYMALLKNLRNIMKQAPEHLGAAIALLQDRNLIKGSLVLPFRYYTAYKELQEESGSMSRVLIPALAAACDIALDNVSKLPGRTLIALDKSGSMQGQQIEIGSQLAAILYKANDAALMLFDTAAQYLQPSPNDATLTLQQTILMNCRHMGGTDFNCVFGAAKEKYDRVIFISDEQHWVGHPVRNAYKAYCKKFGVESSIFMIDTAGYGSLAFPESKVYAVAGFSEKIFDLMSALEEDRTALVNRIEAVQF